jgi:hypothetical protein
MTRRLSEQQTTTEQIRPDDDRHHNDRFDKQHDSYRRRDAVLTWRADKGAASPALPACEGALGGYLQAQRRLSVA